jgi:SpoVK/Ycf46/Vps4 family AAA+-type ATPase
VFVIAATNRADIIDPAIMRPGRLDKILFIPLPDAADRSSILQTLLKNTPIAGDIDIEAIVPMTE